MKNFILIGYIYIQCLSVLIAQDRFFLLNHKKEIIKPEVKIVTDQYIHHHPDYEQTVMKLCGCRRAQTCPCFSPPCLSNSCNTVVSFSDQNIDQFVALEVVKKFTKALQKGLAVHDENGIHSLLTVMDVYDLPAHRSADPKKTYAQQLCDGDFHGAGKPLHFVSGMHKKTDIAAILLENGASINVLDEKKCYPLDYAVHANNKAMITLLLQYNGKCSWPSSIKKLQKLGILKSIILLTPKIE